MDEKTAILRIKKRERAVEVSLRTDAQDTIDSKELTNELQLLKDAYHFFLRTFHGVKVRGKTEVSDETLYEVFVSQPEREREFIAAMESGYDANIQRVYIQRLGAFIHERLLPKTVKNVLAKMDKASYLALNVGTELSWIPWELTFDGRGFLATTFCCGRTKTPLTARSAHRSSPTVRFLLVYNPTGDLDATESEANFITNHLMMLNNVSIFRRGQEIRSSAFAELVGQGSFDAIHYAGHAEFDLTELSQSKFIFQDGPCFADTLTSSLQLPPKIFFVDGCTSALGPFPNELLEKGVTCYVGTLWPVSDEPAGDLAATFYRRALRGETLGKALKEARLRSFERLRYGDLTWAAYILYGNPTDRLFPEA